MVSNIFYFHPYLGKIPILTNIFQRGWNHQLGNFEGLTLNSELFGLVSYNDRCYTKKKHLEHGEVSVWKWNSRPIFFLFHANLARFQFQRCILYCTFQSILDSTNGGETHRTLELLDKILTNWDCSNMYNSCDMFSISQLKFLLTTTKK